MPAEILRYGAVLLNGARDDLTKFAMALRKAGFHVGRPNASVLRVDDVSDEELRHLETSASSYGCYVESTRSPRWVDAAPEPELPKPEFLDVEPGRWYFAENVEDEHPFMLIRSQELQKRRREGEPLESMLPEHSEFSLTPEDRVVLQLELLDARGNTPRRFEADAETVATFGLRPATEEDFVSRDLPVPAQLRMIQRFQAKTAAPDTKLLKNYRFEK